MKTKIKIEIEVDDIDIRPHEIKIKGDNKIVIRGDIKGILKALLR